MVHIGPAAPADIPALATLMSEMDAFYGDPTPPSPPEHRHTQIHNALFGPHPAAITRLAWDHDPRSGPAAQLLGFATFSFLWPAAGITRSLFVRELYIRETHRRTGLGTQLMLVVIAFANDHQCSRVDLTTDGNSTAHAFYHALGFAHTDKGFHRLEGLTHQTA